MNLKSGYPFWLIQSGLPYDYPRLTTSISTDVVILGGGISGALAAYHLIKKGIGCIVIDGRTIGLGSTSASTSLLQYEIDTPLSKLIHLSGYHNAVTAYQLCRDAIYKLEDIADKIGFNDFQRKKSLYYAARQKDTASLKEEFLTRKKNGFAVQWLPPDQLAEQYNIKAPGAILSRDGAQTNAYLFTHALLQHGIKKGVRVFDRSPVTSIQNHKRGISLITDTGNVIKARSMIYANGYEVVDYIDKKIVKLESTYATISQHMEESVPFWKNEVMIWNTADPYLYMRSTKDHRIIVGGRDEDYFNPHKRDKLLPKKTRQLVKDFKEVFPKLPFEPEFSWTGTFGSTKDGLPFIGKYPKVPHAYFSLGFGGNGITFSQIGAEIITGLILKNKNQHADIFAFNRI